jgi:AAA+ superfamily predicted ATPase
MSDALALLIRSGVPLIAIETTDEERAAQIVEAATRSLSRPLWEWSMTHGLRGVDAAPDLADEKPAGTGKAIDALHRIRDSNSFQTVYLFKDLGPHCKDALVHRTLRDLIAAFAERKSTIVMVDAIPAPEEIRRFAVRHEIGWPTAEELESVVKKTYQRLHKEFPDRITSKLSKREGDQLVQTLRGLSCAQVQRVVAAAVFNDYALNAADLPRIVESKRLLLGTQGCLEAIAVDFTPDDIGGLENLKSWLALRRKGFTPEAREFGLEPPRGVLMLGVPGCGKSLCAKVIAADWKMPLLRLDPGVLYQKFIGESESQLRQALAQAEAMSPCVLWIDEIEKAFASAAAASADGGLSKRMFGTLLTWMQDHRHPIFIIATANDISALPPELMRKGRFDEVFFIDLPTAAVRAEILGIHLQRRKRDPREFKLADLAAATEGFSGSELEQVVVSGLFSAFSRGKSLADAHLFEEAKKTRPLSVLNAEQIAALRQWAADRCVSADKK